jgi:hypothetical protein
LTRFGEGKFMWGFWQMLILQYTWYMFSDSFHKIGTKMSIGLQGHSDSRCRMVVLNLHDTPAQDTVDVAVVLRSSIPGGGTKPGSEYGFECDHILQTRHSINISNLHLIKTPSNTDHADYWRYWRDCHMTEKGMEQFALDTQGPSLPGPSLPDH